MLATLGRVNEFDGTKGDDWPEYVERLEYFFEAHRHCREEARSFSLSHRSSDVPDAAKSRLSCETWREAVHRVSGEANEAFQAGAVRNCRKIQVP